jgi:hypothetical protein
MSGKRTKQLRLAALQSIKELKEKHKKDVELFSKQLWGRGEPCLFRKIKKDYIAGRIDSQLNPIGA